MAGDGCGAAERDAWRRPGTHASGGRAQQQGEREREREREREPFNKGTRAADPFVLLLVLAPKLVAAREPRRCEMRACAGRAVHGFCSAAGSIADERSLQAPRDHCARQRSQLTSTLSVTTTTNGRQVCKGPAASRLRRRHTRCKWRSFGQAIGGGCRDPPAMDGHNQRTRPVTKARRRPGAQRLLRHSIGGGGGSLIDRRPAADCPPGQSSRSAPSETMARAFQPLVLV
jgi:hypothetical protein